MDWLEAVSSWIGSLAWPVTVLVLGLVLRHQIGAALRNLRHLEAPGVEADFGDELAHAEATADALSDTLPRDPGPTGHTHPEQPTSTPSPRARLPHQPGHVEVPEWRPGPVDPSASIIRTWRALHDEVVEYAHVAGVLPRDRKHPDRGVSVLVDALRAHGRLEPSAADLIMELSDLRDRVAHGRHVPTPGEAITYEATAGSATRLVRQRRAQDTNDDGHGSSPG